MCNRERDRGVEILKIYMDIERDRKKVFFAMNKKVTQSFFFHCDLTILRQIRKTKALPCLGLEEEGLDGIWGAQVQILPILL